jgi:hypothetical protein
MQPDSSEEFPSELLPQTPSTFSEFGRNLEDILPEPIVPVDAQLERLKEFLDTEWGLPAVENQLRVMFMGGMPPIPPPQRWVIGRYVNIPELIWQQVQSEKFLEDTWPSIRMLLGVDVCNTAWAAQALTVLALFNVIRILPIIGDQ